MGTASRTISLRRIAETKYLGVLGVLAILILSSIRILAMPNHRFPKALRLLSPREFERVFAARLSAGDSSIVLYGAANDLEYPRIGLTVSRKVGTAIVRNRWKRLLREAFRLKQHELPSFDFVCIPRAATPPPLAHLLESLPELARTIQRKHVQRERRNQPDAEPLAEPDTMERPA